MSTTGSTTGTTTETLIAAFGFGIVVNAASAALFLYISGHGSAIFRDGLRLVLITFLLSAALWAQIDFIATVIDTRARTACQVGIIFTTFFDQLARFSIEQYLLWAVNSGTKTGVLQLIPQTLLGARFVVGMVFVGFSRPTFDPVCVSVSSVLPLAVVVVVLDAVLVIYFAWRAFGAGLVKEIRTGGPGATRSKSILLVMAGFTTWTGTSVAMLLGMNGMDLILRTTIPSVGLLLLIFVVTGCNGVLATKQERPPRAPESPGHRDIGTAHSRSTSDSGDYPPSRYEDLKRGDVMSVTAFIQPRDAPRPDKPSSGLPNISRPITGVNGMGGFPIQGQLFPPPRPAPEAAKNETRRVEIRPQVKTKRSLFDLKGGPATSVTVGRLAISNPILEANGDQNPLNKIPTIDLETAARNEKERRANDLQRASALIASRPAPPPPEVAPEDAVQRAKSLKRKEVASIGAQPKASSSLEVVPTGATSSAQLSPGTEELRRRSPRHSTILDKPVPPRPVSPPQKKEIVPPLPVAPPRTKTQTAPPQPQATAPPIRQEKQTAPPRPAIRPSRQLPPPVEAPQPEPARTGLQRRPTNGLPGNPRAMAMKDLENESQAQTQQTVMFVNDIVYDDPQIVEDIMNEASVLHRPRPIKRKPEKDRGIFPAEPSPSTAGHRRSKSGGSIISRKSILQSTPGSPTQLPPLPLPPPPKTAANFQNPQNPNRPLPNDTRSMTFDEKMTLLFPTPPSGSDGGGRPSSIPQLPPLPSNFTASGDSPTFPENGRMSKSTNRTTKSSIKTENIFEVDELPLNPSNDYARDTREQSMADELGSSWLPGYGARTETSTRPSMTTTAKRASSPVLPPIRNSAMTESTDTRYHDDTTTNWGSVHSPVAAVPIQGVRQNARTTYIKGEQEKNNDDRQTMTIMLDTSVAPQGNSSRTSWFVDDITPIEGAQKQWHRRIGDEALTFSGRKEMVRSRKGPPPAPLLLGPPSTKNPVIIKAAEPSPLEPPEQAIEFIQAQLRKFEQPQGSANESPGQRLRLLDNLEKEMDMQAGRWQDMQHDLSRDSMSTIKTSPDLESRRESTVSSIREFSREPSLKPSVAADRRAAKRSRMRSSATAKSIEDPVSTRSSMEDTSRASMWQQRLAEAQSEYMDNANQLMANRNVNYKAMAQLGSPTPPDSDDSDVERELRRPRNIDTAVAQASKRDVRKSLWTPGTQLQTPSTALLWTPAPETSEDSSAETELPGAAVRPVSRIESNPLEIESSELWQGSKSSDFESTEGLWQSSNAQPEPKAPAAPQSESRQSLEVEQEEKAQQGQSQKAPRPLTQRPPRRGRRATLLPDILESPEPLPDKRGTLGIYQFPWGERSDTAYVQPRGTILMAMPGTMTTGGQSVSAALEARAKQLEAAEYSSSFFDDYDDDEEQDSDENDSDGDDGFDETTLWEIASLLKTELVPSKNSLLPPPHPSSIVEEYITEMPSDDDAEDDFLSEEILVGIEEEQVVPALKLTDPKLWVAKKRAAREAKGNHGVGVAQPDDQTWDKYDSTQETSRAKLRQSDSVEIQSTKLWGAAQKEESAKWTAKKSRGSGDDRAKSSAQSAKDELLWEAPTAVESTQKSSTVESAKNESTSTGLVRKNSKGKGKKASKAGLWAPPSTPVSVENSGMFKVSPKPADNRTTAEDPAAINMTRKSRILEQKPLEQLKSANLWTAENPSGSGRNWLVPPESVEILEATELPEAVATADLEHANDTTDSSDAGAKQSTWWQKMKKTIGVAPVEAEPSEIGVQPLTPLRRQYRSNVAVQGDWNAALREAILASYPRMPRQIATPAMWEEALREAISRSKTCDVSKMHPVFAASSLTTKSESFHPAATGYTFDVANVHPVFFGSVTITCDEEHIHPAMAEYVARKPRRQWSTRERTERSLSRSDSRRRRKEAQDAANPNPTVPSLPFAPAPAADPVNEDALLAKRNMILAQIEALEREKQFAEQAVRQTMRQGSSSGYAASQDSEELWAKPSNIDTSVEPVDGSMWTAGAPTPKSGKPAIVAKRSDAESEAIRSKSRKDKHAKAAAASDGVSGSSSRGREMKDQPMWNRYDDEQVKRSNSRSRERDWLDESSKKKAASRGVMLRY